MYNEDCKMSTAVAFWRGCRHDGRTDKEILEILESDGSYLIALVIGGFVRSHINAPAGVDKKLWDKHLSFVAQGLEEKFQDICKEANKRVYDACTAEARTAIVTSLAEAVWNAF